MAYIASTVRKAAKLYTQMVKYVIYVVTQLREVLLILFVMLYAFIKFESEFNLTKAVNLYRNKIKER